MSAIQTREQLGQALKEDSLATIYVTAFVFLTAGSLWLHLSLGVHFLRPQLMFSWLALHVCSFLMLRFKSRQRWFLFSALIAYEFYCISLVGLGFRILPLAPVFFAVTIPTLMASYRWQPRFFVPFWAVLWCSCILWTVPAFQTEDASVRATLFAVALNALFVFGFCWIARAYADRQIVHLASMGPRESFDVQRIHAARLQTMGELSASLAHEIAGPLTNIHGYFYQLEEEWKEIKQSNELIDTTLNRMGMNIDRVLSIARVLRSFSRKNFQPSERRKINLKDVYEDAVLLTQEHFKLANVELICKDPDRDAFVMGDRTELSQIAVNFLMNAKDACKSSAIKKVLFSMGSVGGKAELWVQDSGGGVSAENYTQVFAPFFTTKGVDAGTGLGLYISKMIADRHKAEIGFDNQPSLPGMPAGARFYLRIQKCEDAKADESDVA